MAEIEARLPPKLSFLFEPGRYKIAYGGRGAAKSWGFARALLIQAVIEPLRVLCAREIQNSIVDSVHRLLSDQIVALGLETFYRITQTSITGSNGSEFFFAGLRTQDVGKIKSYEGVNRCWIEEAQVVSKRSWDILIPTIRAENSEIWITFNPELDTDETYQRFVENPPAGARIVKIDYHDNPWFPAVLEVERLALQARDPESYANVWEGKCRAALEGAIYVHEIEAMHQFGRLRPVPYDPMLKVHTVWDLGWNDQTSIIFVQRLASELRVIDYIEDSHRNMADYVTDIKSRPWNWGTDYIPHDGAAKKMETGLSAEDVLRRLGRRPVVGKPQDVEAGIKAARLIFPRVYFDKDKAVRLVHCLKRYRRSINSTTNEPGAPLHDEHSHGADAFRYMAAVADKLVNDDAYRHKKLEYSNVGIV